jgi:Zn-dependent protease
MNILYTGVLYLVPLILSLSVHECAHAWAAKRLGDDTAEKLGRLTLNPLSHIDPIGTLILPMMLIYSMGAPYFAWAKPVPYESSRFRRDISARSGAMLVAFAGPLSNLLLLILAALTLTASMHWFSLPEAFYTLLTAMMRLNAALFIFNLIPIFPLDGHKVLSGLLPVRLAERYDAVNYQFGNWALLIMVVAGVGRLLRYPVEALVHSVASLAGLA